MVVLCFSCYVFVIVFFFKQKTAYEMRISDWSSDVCSSDLRVTALHVAIVIVGFRNLPDIQRCLGALEASTYRDFEILICENGGDQAFSELVHALPSALPGGQPIRAVKAPDRKSTRLNSSH